MNIVEKPIVDLIAYENNPKIHTEKQIQQIMIRAYGLIDNEIAKGDTDWVERKIRRSN